ncbi:MAG: AAA family ATPase, partial [Cetobacterium sp.]
MSFIKKNTVKNVVKACLSEYLILMRGEPKVGKAQPLDCKVLTPTGFVEMGSLHIGDKVIGKDGKEYNVTGVFPQGKLESYKVTFDDGATTECNDEHIWNVSSNTWKGDSAGARRNLTLKEIVKSGIKRNVGGRTVNMSRKWDIPVIDMFESKPVPHIITPYLLGLLIGDGYLNGNSLQLSTSEENIISNVKDNLDDEYTIIKSSGENFTWVIKKPDGECRNKYIQEMSRLGLSECLSGDKFIPSEYMMDSYENKLDLLRGLVDTDGNVDKSKVSITTTSKRLKDDIVWLCRSLGMIAYVTFDKRVEKYTTGKCFRITIQSKDPTSLFTTDKHRVRYIDRKARLIPKRYIESVEYVGMKDMQCIMIDSEDHLYITDDFIVTHNTTLYADIVKEFYGKEEAGFMIPFETGYKAIDGLNVFGQTISPGKNYVFNDETGENEEYNGWKLFTTIVNDLVATRKETEIKVVCIDTVDRFFDVAIEETLRLSRIETKKPCKSLNDAFNGYGKGRIFLGTLVKEQIQRLRNSGYGIIILGHVKHKTIKDKIQQEEYQMLASNLTEDLDSIIANDADFILMLSNEKTVKDGLVAGSDRYIRFRGDGYYSAGSRFQHLPEKIDLNAKAFVDAFN